MNRSQAPSARQPRKKKLVQPGLQLGLVGRFAGLAVLAMLLQFLLLAFQLTRGAADLGPEGGELAQQVPGLLLQVLAITAVIVVPIIVLVGITMTHRVVGPLARIESYLEGVKSGRETEELRLRPGDDLGRIVGLINDVTAARRESASDGSQAREAA